MNPPDARVREEASDVALTLLTEQQQDAARRVYELLSSFLRLPFQKARPEHWHFRPWVDARRGNSVVLLDGGRGSGKTTVLLSLVALWARPWWVDSFVGPRLEPTNDPSAKWMCDIQAEQRFVPLDVIDLKVLPEDASLLMRLASSFRRVIDEIDELAEGRLELKSKQQWAELARAIAYGWDANVQARRAQIDPEMYMIELEDSERRGSDVHIRFRAFIDALQVDFQKVIARKPAQRQLRTPQNDSDVPSDRQEQRALFIVPIDDSDMDPRRAAELIELLRVVWHPSLAFLMTGDTDMFLHALRAQTGKKLTPHPPGGGDFVTRLAAEVYERAVPSQHRCALPPLPPRQRLSVDLTRGVKEPAASSGSKDAEPAMGSIKETLQALPLPPGAPLAHADLALYFAENPWACAALPGRLRQLVDLRHSLRERTGQGEGLGALEAVIDIWKRAIASSDLAPQDRPRVARLVELQGGQLEIAASALKSNITHRVLHRSAGQLQGSELVVSVPVEITFTLPSGGGDIDLPKEVASALILACDVAADGRGYFVGDSPAFGLARANLVHNEFELGAHGSGTWRWPHPKLPSFLDYLLIYEGWIKALATLTPALVANNASDTTGSEWQLDNWLCLSLLEIVLTVAKQRSLPSPVDASSATLSQRGRVEALLASSELLRPPVSPTAPTLGRNAGFVRWLNAFSNTLQLPEAGIGSVTRRSLRSLALLLYPGRSDAATERWRRQELGIVFPELKGQDSALSHALRAFQGAAR